MSSLIILIAQTLSTFLQIYFILLIIRILLSWFPSVDWFNPPFSILSQLTDPYLNLFRSIIPPLGGIDISPILAIFLLQFVSSLIVPALYSLAAMTYTTIGWTQTCFIYPILLPLVGYCFRSMRSIHQSLSGQGVSRSFPQKDVVLVYQAFKSVCQIQLK